MEDDNYRKVNDYALRLLSFRPRSISEIYIKLQRFCTKRNLPDELSKKIIAELIEKKFLDDCEFAKWWIDQRRSFHPKGEKAIRLELLHKGVDKKVIDSAVIAISGEGLSDHDLAMKVVEKRLSRFQNLSPIQLKIKIRDFLLGRGFDWETINKVIDSLVKKS